MKFSTALVASVLSASAVMAAPGTAARRARALAKRSEGIRKSQPMIPSNITAAVNGPEDANVEYSTNWAGAALEGSGYTAVTGTFTVPAVSLPKGGSSGTYYSASAWVGIDGYTCETAILQTGLDFNLEDGETSYDAWYEWYPDYAYDFTGISFSAGDSVTVTVTVTSSTGGTAVIENNTKGTSVTHTFTGQTGDLCQTNAEWIVEDFTESNGYTSSLVPLVDFGTVTFTDAYATTSSGTQGPSSAEIVEMISENGDEVLTDVTTSSSGVVVKYE